ncbi:MAG: replication-associated recombination protein A [Bdellovibrionales bacterium]
MTQRSLFDATSVDQALQPLASRLRPQKLQDILGQGSLLDEKSVLARGLKSGYLPNLILWGPPGSGKTTLALVLAQELKAFFIQLNAVEAGVKAIKEAAQEGRHRRLMNQERTVVFIDEIHRLNKGQQDVLLPHLESGDITLIGATTENPSYELNRALLSRSQTLVLKPLDHEALEALFTRALSELGISESDFVESQVRNFLIQFADGDGRRLLNSLETLYHVRQQQTAPLDKGQAEAILGHKSLAYDKNSEYHYDLISAFIKSVRGSDADAALYYLVRMLEGGEDPVFISRRLIILASEDVGNADPKALPLAVAGLQAVEAIGLPEARITLAHVTTYLASCPKSNRSYAALNKAQDYVQRTGTLPVPLALRSSKTELAKGLKYGEGYQYPHDFPTGWVNQTYLPAEAQGQTFYEPSSLGFEKTLQEFRAWQKRRRDGEGS